MVFIFNIPPPADKHLMNFALRQRVITATSHFGFKPKKMLTRLSYTDFDGTEFINNFPNNNNISEKLVEKYAPNVVEGVNKLSIWAKNL